MVEEQKIERLLIRSWPKLIFMWPTAVLAFVVGCLQWTINPNNDATAQLWGGMFLLMMGINLTIITFDFPRSSWLAILAIVMALVFGLLLLNRYFEILKPIADFFKGLDLRASVQFYFAFFWVMFLLYIGMLVSVRFDYWELTANELVHHTGMLGDIERFSTAGLKLNKEITDVFEYLIAGSGTIILNVPATPRPIVLHNVLGIQHIEERADKILNARFVRVESPNSEEAHVARSDEEV